MINFEIKGHREIDISYQGINLTEFSFKANKQISNKEILDTFLRTKHFAFDSLRDCQKSDTEKGYLRQAFNIDNIKITDFKKGDKEQVLKFLLDFINESDWGDDRSEFAKLLDKYFEIHNQFSIDNDFFIISKDWFGNNDDKLIEPESWTYIYYFLIISIDRNLNLLTFTEWTYD